MKTRRLKISALICAWLFLAVACTKGTGDSPNQKPGGSYDTLTPEQKALITAVQQTGAQSVNGKTVSFICQLSSAHVDYMIQQGSISHDGFSQRSQSINENGGTKSGEIVASNCGQPNMEASAQQCATSWVNSPEHWVLMKQYWDGFCYDMKQSSNGCYYCIGLFGDGSL